MLTCLLAVTAFYFYTHYFADFVAEAVVADQLPSYIPKRMQAKIQALSKPINEGAEAMLVEMDSSDIPMEKVLSVIDRTNEKKAYSILDEINSMQPQTTDEVFDIAKRHVSTDFDIEIFRQPFNDHVDMKQVRKAIDFANQNRKTHDLEFNTAKAILRKILTQKEKEYKAQSRADR